MAARSTIINDKMMHF